MKNFFFVSFLLFLFSCASSSADSESDVEYDDQAISKFIADLDSPKAPVPNLKGELTRELAQYLIEQKVRFPGVYTIEIRLTASDMYFTDIEKLRNLQSVGLITYQQTNRSNTLGVKGALTPEGEKYRYGPDRSAGSFIGTPVKAAQVYFNAISGIKDRGAQKVAECTFLLKDVNLFASYWEGLKEGHLLSQKYYFEKYDDGWRIEDKK